MCLHLFLLSVAFLLWKSIFKSNLFLPKWSLWRQCDQIGQFLKVLGTKILTKVAHIFGDFLCFLERNHSKVNTVVATFWVSFWATFNFIIWSYCLEETNGLTSWKIFLNAAVMNAKIGKCFGYFLTSFALPTSLLLKISLSSSGSFLNGFSRPLFPLFSSFQHSWQ